MFRSVPIICAVAFCALLCATNAWAGWQRDMVCQGSCGAGCGPCPTTGQRAQQRPPSGPSAEEIAESQAEGLHKQGVAAYNNGDYATALRLLEEARRLWPDTPNIDNDLRNLQGMTDRRKSGERFAASVDAVKQGLLNERNTGTGQLDPGNGGLEFMPADAVTPTPSFVPSGSALIGGTGWIIGYNVPPGSKPELLARSQQILKRWSEAEGIPYNEKVDFAKYNFVLGIAASTDVFDDLTSRVVFDQLSNGQYSASQQKAYNSLKGRQFDELACHSNGAMICLAALQNHDTLAKHVVLFGPQITPESLSMWNELVQSGRINTIKIYLNRGDPVPAVSMLASNPTAALTATIAPVLAAPLFNADVMHKAITAFAPSAQVSVLPCSDSVTTACHDLKVYKKSTGACPASSGRTVPGTTLPGRGGVTEPPPPCL